MGGAKGVCSETVLQRFGRCGLFFLICSSSEGGRGTRTHPTDRGVEGAPALPFHTLSLRGVVLSDDVPGSCGQRAGARLSGGGPRWGLSCRVRTGDKRVCVRACVRM